MRRIALCGLLLAAMPTLAAAQDTPDSASCRNEALPFPGSDANRLSDAQLQQLLSGKTFTYVRESIRTPGRYVRLARDLRADGSFVLKCDFSRSRNGSDGWKACQSIGSQTKRAAGARDVGVWRIENRSLCITQAAFKNNVCFAIHRQGAALAARTVVGPRTYCGEGPVTVE